MSTQFYSYGSWDEVYGPDEPTPEPPEPAFLVADDDTRDLEGERARDLETARRITEQMEDA